MDSIWQYIFISYLVLGWFAMLGFIVGLIKIAASLEIISKALLSVDKVVETKTRYVVTREPLGDELPEGPTWKHQP